MPAARNLAGEQSGGGARRRRQVCGRAHGGARGQGSALPCQLRARGSECRLGAKTRVMADRDRRAVAGLLLRAFSCKLEGQLGEQRGRYCLACLTAAALSPCFARALFPALYVVSHCALCSFTTLCAPARAPCCPPVI